MPVKEEFEAEHVRRSMRGQALGTLEAGHGQGIPWHGGLWDFRRDLTTTRA